MLVFRGPTQSAEQSGGVTKLLVPLLGLHVVEHYFCTCITTLLPLKKSDTH